MKFWKPEANIFAAASIGAMTYPIAQWSLHQMDVLMFHIIRFPLLTLLFLPAVLRAKPEWRNLWKAALPGAFLWLGIMAWSYGVMTSDQLGSAAFITSLMSIIAPFIARIMFGTRIHRSTLIGLVIATIGLAMLTLENGLTITPASQWMLLSAVLQGMYLVTNSQYASQFNPMVMSWSQFLCCAILSLLAAPFLSDFHIEPSMQLGAALLFMVFISTGLRFTLMTIGQRSTPAARAAIIVMTEPVLVAFISLTFMGETMTTIQMLGGGLILAAIYLASPRSNLQAG